MRKSDLFASVTESHKAQAQELMVLESGTGQDIQDVILDQDG